MKFTPGFIEEVKYRNPIESVVSSYVNLKRAGSNMAGLCPYHNEKTPSIFVFNKTETYHSYGCGAGGDVITFIMSAENLDYPSAVEFLCKRAGMEMPAESGSEKSELALRARIYALNKEAARFFHKMLFAPESEAARKYLEMRKVTSAAIIAFGLGYAPKTFDTLRKHMLSEGFTDEELKIAFLCGKSEKNGKTHYFDYFRGRIIFPIIDNFHNVIAFGGRAMNNAGPKYLNTSDTPVFKKSRNLFALNIARTCCSEYMILCEGYMGVIAMLMGGFTNAVATLGTALTPEQARIMAKYTKSVVVSYDSDEAGTTAAKRAIPILTKAGLDVRVLQMRGAKDPDEYINKNGVEKFKEAVKNAMPATEFKISLIKKQYDVTSTDGKILFIDEVVNIFTKLKDAVEVDAYITKVAEDTGISREAIASKYREKISKGSYKRIPTKNEYQKKVEQRKRETTKNQMVTSSLLEAEKRLLGLISQSKKLYKMSSAQIKADEFATDVYRRLAKSMYDSYENGMSPDPAMMLNDFSNDDLSEASEVFYNLEVYSGDEETVKELLYTIKLEKLNMRINAETDPTNLMDLFKQREELLNEKNTWEE